MTSSNPEPPSRAEDVDAAGLSGSPVRPGIYLEEKKSSIGTGGTAKTTSYRTFWVTVTVGPDGAEMLLLDDDFKPTGIRETFSAEVLLGPGWHFIAEGEKRYQRLRPHLDRLLTPAAAPKPTAAQPAAKPVNNWWSGGESNAPPKDPFARDPKTKTAPAPAKKGGWWEK